ncbi:MAG: NB-ARC domain-containing protein [Chloroflexota bacterium]|nr:NB-ARC domain-containing protein [Chloroflexota bacterium]
MDQLTPQPAQWTALKKIVKRLPAHLAYYGSALGAIVIAGSGAEGMASIVGNIGAGLLGSLIAEVAKGEDILDDDVRQRAEEAVTRSDIERLLTERDFWRGYVQLIRRLDAQKAASQDILDELRDGFSKVATAEQLEEVKELLLQALGDKKPSLKPRVFISYRRSDASDFAQRLHDALEAADIDAWLDVRDMPSGDTFIAQIDRAIAAADYFLLVGTPQAIESDYCRDEWKKAIEKYKPIIPVMLMGEYNDLPQEAYAYLNDARDFRDDSQFDAQVAQLVKQIQVKPAPAGEARGLPSLPSHYLPRPELLATLREALTQHKTTILTSPSQIIGMHGMGGVGKSVLSAAISRDYFVRRTFKDGIFWLTFGSEPSLPQIWVRFRSWLGGGTAPFADERDAQDYFQQITSEQECLVILDDVWRSEHARAFLHLGDRCRLLVASRNTRILDELDAHSIALKLLSDNEARQLLSKCSDTSIESLPTPANDILKLCGNLPLALAMIGSMVRRKPTQYWQDRLEELRESDLEEIAARFPEYPYPNLFSALEISIRDLERDLGGEAKDRYIDFAIFPDDVSIPESVPLTFWKPLKGKAIRTLLEKLVERSLLKRNDDNSFSIHDLQLMYLRRVATDVPARHLRLLQEYNPDRKPWSKVSPDGYIHEHLIFHLNSTDDYVEMIKLFSDTSWVHLRIQVEVHSYVRLLGDLDVVWNAALVRLSEQVKAAAEPSYLVDCIRFALITGGIIEALDRYEPVRALENLRCGKWTAAQALQFVGSISNPLNKIRMCIALLQDSEIPLLEADRHEIASSALQTALSSAQPHETALILAQLIPALPKHLIRQGIENLGKIRIDRYIAQAIILLSTRLESEFAYDLFNLAAHIKDKWNGLRAMAVIIPLLSEEGAKDAGQICKERGDEINRIFALINRREQLPEENLDRFDREFAEALSSLNSRYIANAFANLAREKCRQRGYWHSPVWEPWFDINHEYVLDQVGSLVNGVYEEHYIEEGIRLYSPERYISEANLVKPNDVVSDSHLLLNTLSHLTKHVTESDLRQLLRDASKLIASDPLLDELNHLLRLCSELDTETVIKILNDILKTNSLFSHDSYGRRAPQARQIDFSDIFSGLMPHLPLDVSLSSALRTRFAQWIMRTYEWRIVSVGTLFLPFSIGSEKESLERHIAEVRSRIEGVSASGYNQKGSYMNHWGNIRAKEQAAKECLALGDEAGFVKNMTSLQKTGYVPPISEVLTDIAQLKEEAYKVEVISAFIEHFENEQQNARLFSDWKTAAFKILEGLTTEAQSVQLLIAIAPRMNNDEVEKAIASAGKIKNIVARATLLSLLAANLSSQVTENTVSFHDTWSRTTDDILRFSLLQAMSLARRKVLLDCRDRQLTFARYLYKVKHRSWREVTQTLEINDLPELLCLSGELVGKIAGELLDIHTMWRFD